VTLLQGSEPDPASLTPAERQARLVAAAGALYREVEGEGGGSGSGVADAFMHPAVKTPPAGFTSNAAAEVTTEKIPLSFIEMSSGVVTRQKGI
jgi:hypothetical protein